MMRKTPKTTLKDAKTMIKTAKDAVIPFGSTAPILFSTFEEHSLNFIMKREMRTDDIEKQQYECCKMKAPMRATLYGQDIDLEKLQSSHKGGSLALSLAAGRDCTALYEQYHPSKQQSTGFHAELQAAAKHKPSTASWIHTLMCCAVAVLCGVAWRHWFLGNWFALAVVPCLHWLLVANVSHEAAHFGFSKYALVNEMLALSSAPIFYNTGFWYLQHNISHHTSTNDPEKDFDLSHYTPIARLHASNQMSSFTRLFKLSTIAGSFLFSTLAQCLIYPFCRKLKHKYIGKSDHVTARTLTFSVLQYCSSVAVLCVPWFQWPAAKALCFSFGPFMLSSILFMSITQVSHLHSSTQSALKEGEWAAHQVRCCVDYAQGNRFVTFLTGGLNSQGLHHCLPFMSSSRFVDFYPVYRNLCKKHDVQLQETRSFTDAFRSYIHHITELN